MSASVYVLFCLYYLYLCYVFYPMFLYVILCANVCYYMFFKIYVDNVMLLCYIIGVKLIKHV